MSTSLWPTAKPEQVGLSPARLNTLSEALRSRTESGHIPGAVALVCRNDRLAYYESFGRRDPLAADPMPKDAIFRIYSMTKPIVSVAAMMLWEEGRFLLADPVAKYLPEFADQKVMVETACGTRLEPA